MTKKVTNLFFHNMKWLLLCLCNEPETYKKAGPQTFSVLGPAFVLLFLSEWQAVFCRIGGIFCCRGRCWCCGLGGFVFLAFA